MLETSTSGLMSGDGKTERAPQSTATAPVLDSTRLQLLVDVSAKIILCGSAGQSIVKN